MKVIVAFEVPQSTYAAIEELIRESTIRDIDLQGVDLTVERGEYTCVEETQGEDSVDATSVLQAVNRVISGEWNPPAGKGLTIFSVYYEKTA